MDYELMIRLLLAALWGGLVGAEREYRSKSAGFRTMIMISMGACFFTMLSVYIGGKLGNPDRIASNIVSGIGFLGAGVFFRADNKVNGITTAATIWAVAAIGMGIGAGYYFASAAASLLFILVLTVLPYGEQLIDKLNLAKEYTIHCEYTDASIRQFQSILEENHLHPKLVKAVKDLPNITMVWQVHGKEKNHHAFVQKMLSDQQVQQFEFF